MNTYILDEEITIIQSLTGYDKQTIVSILLADEYYKTQICASLTNTIIEGGQTNES